MNLQAALAEVLPMHRPRMRANRANRIARNTRDMWGRFARAAGHALALFFKAEEGGVAKCAAIVPKLHPALAAIVGSQAVERLIGRPALAPGADAAAWLDLDLSGWRPILRIHYRGAQIPGEAVGTEEFASRKGAAVRRCKKNTGVTRDFSFEALIEAAAAARKALIDAGVQITGLCEVRHKSGLGQARGAVAMIALRDASRAPARSR